MTFGAGGSTRDRTLETVLEIQAEGLPAALNGLLDEDFREVRRILLVPPDAVLRRTLHLPAAALENLAGVIGFELDRQTPFRAEQVHHDSRVLPHAADARQIPVQLGLVTRERMARELADVDGLASTLSAVDSADAAGARAGFNFLPAELRARRAHTFAWLMGGLALATLFFLWLGMSRIIDNRADAIVRLDYSVWERKHWKEEDMKEDRCLRYERPTNETVELSGRGEQR